MSGGGAGYTRNKGAISRLHLPLPPSPMSQAVRQESVNFLARGECEITGLRDYSGLKRGHVCTQSGYLQRDAWNEVVKDGKHKDVSCRRNGAW